MKIWTVTIKADFTYGENESEIASGDDAIEDVVEWIEAGRASPDDFDITVVETEEDDY